MTTFIEYINNKFQPTLENFHNELKQDISKFDRKGLGYLKDTAKILEEEFVKYFVVQDFSNETATSYLNDLRLLKQDSKLQESLRVDSTKNKAQFEQLNKYLQDKETAFYLVVNEFTVILKDMMVEFDVQKPSHTHNHKHGNEMEHVHVHSADCSCHKH